MFAPGCAAAYEAERVKALTHYMREAKASGSESAAFACALALVMPALRAHLEQQSNICVVIR